MIMIMRGNWRGNKGHCISPGPAGGGVSPVAGDRRDPTEFCCGDKAPLVGLPPAPGLWMLLLFGPSPPEGRRGVDMSEVLRSWGC